jgi:hypothetical protein
MLKKITTLLCALMMLASVSCFASEDTNCSIAKIEGQKAYLKAGSVQIAKNGIFINVGGELVAINHLETDDNGVFFNIDKNAVEWIRAYCTNCERWFEGVSYRCPYCGKRS